MPVKNEKLYNVWRNIKSKVKKKNLPFYKPWETYNCFKAWCLDNGYKDGKRMFKLDLNDGYTPENCTFIKPIKPVKQRSKFNCKTEGCINLVARRNNKCRTCEVKNRNTSGLNKADYKRDWLLQQKYGISLAEFNYSYRQQNGKCLICDIEMKLPLRKRGQPLDVVAVDHDHVTKKVRGLICNGCNKGLGLFKDNVKILQNAIVYIENKKTCEN